MFIDYHCYKTFAFADTHGMYRRLFVPSEADILICAKDPCEGFNPADLEDFSLRTRLYLQNSELCPKESEYDGIRFNSMPARPYLKTQLAIPEDVDFLITQGPAYGYPDRGLGCKNLFLSMASSHPKYHIFGHVREEGLKRKAMLGGITFINVTYFEEL